MAWLLGDWKVDTTCSEQRTPGGRSFSKSNTHWRSLSQRPVPLVACASLQDRLSGAGAFGSPKLTALSSNLATTWRTREISPCGETLVICSAWACRAPAASRAVMIVFAMDTATFSPSEEESVA